MHRSSSTTGIRSHRRVLLLGCGLFGGFKWDGKLIEGPEMSNKVSVLRHDFWVAMWRVWPHEDESPDPGLYDFLQASDAGLDSGVESRPLH